MALAEEGYGKNAGECAGNAKKKWKPKMQKGTRAQEQMGKNEESTVEILRFMLSLAKQLSERISYWCEL